MHQVLGTALPVTTIRPRPSNCQARFATRRALASQGHDPGRRDPDRRKVKVIFLLLPLTIRLPSGARHWTLLDSSALRQSAKTDRPAAQSKFPLRSPRFAGPLLAHCGPHSSPERPVAYGPPC